MEREVRSVVLDVVKDDECSTILFHTSDDPYTLKYISMDENWKSTPLGIQECRFLPKAIKTYKNKELAIIYSGISASVINTNLDINGMEEESSILFPFAVEDVCPSLFSSEFVYSSVEKCNLYSISQEKSKFSVKIGNDEILSTKSLSIQPSAHPLVYYMTHPNGLLAIDFRTSSPNSIYSKKNYCQLQRIDGDWNHYILADDHEFGICDIRNPVVYNQCWRYTGILKKLNCYQTKDSNAVDFLLTANIQQPNHSELQAASFHRSYLDLSSETPTPIIPSLNNNSMQLVYSSKFSFDSTLLDPLTTPSSSRFDRILGSIVTVGWSDSTHGLLNTFTASINDSVNHIFACNSEERKWESKTQLSSFENQERLHTLDINQLVHKPLEAGEGQLRHLQQLVESGFLSQPKSVYSIQTELITRMNVTLPLEVIEQWLASQNLKAIQVDRKKSVHSTVWVNEEQYQEQMNPFTSSYHPIDRKRIETLSELWNKQ